VVVGEVMRYTIIGIFIIMLSSMVAQDSQKNELKNVQVLPFTTTVEIKEFMKSMAKELGVKCRYCHNPNNLSSDEKSNKKSAREMLRMVQYINGNVMGKLELRSISCWTCHRGQEHPDKKD
jgi:photosynthetic reaction center cytochrome c subunit